VVTLGRIAWSILGVILYTLVGWWIAVRFTGTIFYRQVDHPIEPYNLQTLRTYWLNGKTPAVFVGILDYPGTYLFHILGLHKKNDLYDAKPLFPDQVKKYISENQEEF